MRGARRAAAEPHQRTRAEVSDVSGDHSDPMADDRIIRAIYEDLCAQRPDRSASQIIAEPITCIGDLMRQTALVDAVVATRYHTLVCALKLAKSPWSGAS